MREANINLNRMGRGTPVLATSVGLMPDIVKDGLTGFILENISTECIAKDAIQALEHPNLDEIVKNARKRIEEKYTYEAAVERYRKILEGKHDQRTKSINLYHKPGHRINLGLCWISIA